MSLRLDNVTKQYGTFQLQCSIEIPEGRITGFVGPNGAGKSTTIKAILGLISYDSGEIFLDEKRNGQNKIERNSELSLRTPALAATLAFVTSYRL